MNYEKIWKEQDIKPGIKVVDPETGTKFMMSRVNDNNSYTYNLVCVPAGTMFSGNNANLDILEMTGMLNREGFIQLLTCQKCGEEFRTDRIHTCNILSGKIVAGLMESTIPSEYRLAKIFETNEIVLQGFFTWRKGWSESGGEWKTLETVTVNLPQNKTDN